MTTSPLDAIQRKVNIDGNPLAGATITFEPETFLGPGFKQASATTDERGKARLQPPVHEQTAVRP